MSKDITSILENWDFEPGKISVRKIIGQDKRPKIQLRLDLGLLQMETTGRPDGHRPHGFESLLNFHRQRLEHQGASSGKGRPMQLSPRECEALRRGHHVLSPLSQRVRPGRLRCRHPRHPAQPGRARSVPPVWPHRDGPPGHGAVPPVHPDDEHAGQGHGGAE